MSKEDTEFVQNLIDKKPLGYRMMAGSPVEVRVDLMMEDYNRLLKLAMRGAENDRA